ncbi:MAG: amino acid permease [Planctomycetia bacterium]|nr:amino acid permease [Planctomycetia bacterium]
MASQDSGDDVTRAAARPLKRTTQMIVVSSVMFTFISYWRTAAVVLCDMSSTVYYIGAIVESAIGKAAPWFILAVLLFSYAMRAVYIESSALFVRGGVYRVVKEAMGGFLAKLSVSALLFDYVLTGPISGVSAGQYIVGLALEAVARYTNIQLDEGTRQSIKSAGSVLIACLITLYFFRQNLLGMSESSDKAFKIMIATTVMGVILLTWSLVSLAVKGPVNDLPSWQPDLSEKVEIDDAGKVVPKINPLTGEQEDPLGFIPRVFPSLAEKLRSPESWLSLVGLIGLILAFGHSVLAMSGEETLAQVYREVASPKLPNFKKAAFIVFFYSFALTGTMNLLAMLLIPDNLRMGEYYENWMGGLAMQLMGPVAIRLLLNAFVVVVGFLILAGAVNTSIIGSSGVLSRVAEDGVLPDWFLKPHRRFGTSSRILWLITGLQLFTIIVSRGDMILLGEAYAFGVVWSFVFKTASMVVLRFRDRSPREFKVPFNVRVGNVEVPIGLGLIFLVVLLSALANFLTKQVATISGAIFTAAFLAVFVATERYYEKRRHGAKHEHLEQFNRETAEGVAAEKLGLTKPYRKLVAIRSPQNLFMLEKSLHETDPDTTDAVVMTAKVMPPGGEITSRDLNLDRYDQQLMTAVVERAERAGKQVHPLIVPTNNPFFAIIQTAKNLQVQELIIGASNKFTADEQLEQVAFYWMNLCEDSPQPLTVRILSKDRDVYFDLAGGNRIPKFGEARARSIAQLRAAGLGVRHAMFVHFDSLESSDLFSAVLTMLDPEITLSVARFPAPAEPAQDWLQQDLARAKQLRRQVDLCDLGDSEPAASLLRVAREDHCDLILIGVPSESEGPPSLDVNTIVRHAPCRVCVIAQPEIPQEVTP